MKFFPRKILEEGHHVSVKKGILCQVSILLFFFLLKGFRRWEIMIVSILYIKFKTYTTGHN